MADQRLEAPTKRLLTTREAADYCGMGTGAFRNNCPVVPVTLARPGVDEARMYRYDVRALDAWIDTLGGSRTYATDMILLDRL